MPQNKVDSIQISLTPEDQDSILKAVGIALEETGNYLDSGDLMLDYGPEVQSVCDMNVNRYQSLSAICVKLGDNDLSRQCLELAEEFRSEKGHHATK